MFGSLKHVFEAKEKVWEGHSEDVWNEKKKLLKDAGIFAQAFKVNQETPTCNGDCGSCSSKCDFKEDTPIYEKMGSGLSDDLLKPKPDLDLYAIYVAASQVEKAKKELGI